MLATSIKFVLFIVVIYTVVLTVLTHIPEILAVSITMGIVHLVLQDTKKGIVKSDGGVTNGNDSSRKI